jgi:serine/threonine protein kinase
LLILRYADGGNLRNYLKQNFTTLTWDNKIKLAYQITEGIKYLHEKNIILQNLNSNNIVIHQGEAKVIDFEIAKSETDLYEGVFGVIVYIDPKVLENFSYKYDKKSNIYSLGVLMWELSSGRSPFINEKNGSDLMYHLVNGYREKPISGTPDKYLELYELCWNDNPDLRPSINEVFIELGKLLSTQDDINKSNNDGNAILNILDNLFFFYIILN